MPVAGGAGYPLQSGPYATPPPSIPQMSEPMPRFAATPMPPYMGNGKGGPPSMMRQASAPNFGAAYGGPPGPMSPPNPVFANQPEFMGLMRNASMPGFPQPPRGGEEPRRSDQGSNRGPADLPPTAVPGNQEAASAENQHPKWLYYPSVSSMDRGWADDGRWAPGFVSESGRYPMPMMQDLPPMDMPMPMRPPPPVMPMMMPQPMPMMMPPPPMMPPNRPPKDPNVRERRVNWRYVEERFGSRFGYHDPTPQGGCGFVTRICDGGYHHSITHFRKIDDRDGFGAPEQYRG
eukprot:gnl/TRDRNA2_/TRDRNA2_39266_c0_seq1.p1 gnl/TRDRNA2_/TRDRNA2_39266_c0~~gnl/TRDRNA2_/TRDRNA2_39266_c0_seq1.p1  ORF type:complete len:305 (-),score=41.14 gnl/TRDRNA2_/TRDRNA2_39266_c0_seq1:201-1070(-)